MKYWSMSEHCWYNFSPSFSITQILFHWHVHQHLYIHLSNWHKFYSPYTGSVLVSMAVQSPSNWWRFS